MQLYRIKQGPYRLGPGAVVSITAEQARTRAHNLEAYVAPLSGVRVKVKNIAQIEFKTGEIVGLESVPKGMLERVERYQNEAEAKPVLGKSKPAA